jgi:hypothetical protein
MTRTLRFLTAALLVGLLLLPTTAAGLQGEEGDEAEVTQTTVESGAAVEVPPVAEVETADPWTTRYLIPTIVALTVVVIGGAVVYYLVRIRARYSVAAE